MNKPKQTNSWDSVPAILQNIRKPEFPDREFTVTSFGAAGDGETDCTEAFRLAVAACHSAGGGTVTVPAGVYRTGAIRLLSNVRLHVQAGAVISFIADSSKYPLERSFFEGNECFNHSPFVYAYGETNIALTGSGTLDGNGGEWRERYKHLPNPSLTLRQMAEDGIPPEKRIFGDGYYLRPNMVEFISCRNVWIEGVTLLNSVMWMMHPVLCSNVIVQGVTVTSHGPNSDGFDPECCRDIWVKDCVFNTTDDGIAIKAGRNADGRRIGIPTENMVVQGCSFPTAPEYRNGIALGSELTAGIRNVFFEDCAISGRFRGIFIKSNTLRGGTVEHIYFRRITIRDIERGAIVLGMNYGREKGKNPPLFRDIEFSDISAERCQVALDLQGVPESPLEDIRFTRCTFEQVENQQFAIIKDAGQLNFEQVKVNGKPVDTSAGLEEGALRQ